MNKKAYQQPTMNVVKLQHHSMICQSMTSANGPLNYGGAGGDREAGSRRGGRSWDDDEDNW